MPYPTPAQVAECNARQQRMLEVWRDEVRRRRARYHEGMARNVDRPARIIARRMTRGTHSR